MKKYLKFLYILCLLPVTMAAQGDIDSVLYQIERNNTTLTALRKHTDADKIGNKTGIYLDNPEVGINYLWSDPTSLGNRTDFNVRQSFDFPTAYGFRRQISSSRDAQAELEYQEQRRKIILEARLLCAEVIYSNARVEEFEQRVSHAQQLADAYQAMYEQGEVGILEHNKAQLHLLNISQELETIKIEKHAILQQLSALNGGYSISLSSSTWALPLLPDDFDKWYGQVEPTAPGLIRLNREAEISRQEAKLNRALSLPKASAGYMSESRTGEQFMGITAGISIPLWENKNTVKYAEARALAFSSMVEDYKLRFYSQLKIQYERALSLQKTVTGYRHSLSLYQNSELLKKAFDKGEISLLDYLMEMSLAYSTVDHFMQAQDELNRSIILFYQYFDGPNDSF